MRFEILVIVDTDMPPEQLLSEVVSNLQSVNVQVEVGSVLLDDEEIAIFPAKEQK